MVLIRTILTAFIVSYDLSFGQARGFLREIENSFNDGKSVTCLAILVHKGMSWEESFDSLESPYYLVNDENPENVKFASHSCKNHIILTRETTTI